MSGQRQRFGELPPDVLRQSRMIGGPVVTRKGAATIGAQGIAPAAGGYNGAGVLRASIAFFTYQTAAGSRQFLSANPQRSYLAMLNNSASALWMNLNTAAGNSIGLRLPAGGLFEWFAVIPTGSVNVWGPAAGLSFTLAEG